MPIQNDPLTRLPNRLALDAALKQAIDASSSIALAMLDIDAFLEINTDFGQSQGDQVLRALAEILEEFAPGQVYHLSGDEFAFAMPQRTLEQAFLQMESLRLQVQASERFELPDGRKLSVTIGVAQYPRDAKDARGLVQAADAALSSAKEGGRNQVSLPPNEEMVMKSCYYPASSIRKLKQLAERLGRKESPLLREALDDLFRKYDIP
jgi:diguanylate cyclase (GGDEF)-like protein